MSIALRGTVRMSHIPNLRHSVYAGDITLWITRGSDRAMQDVLSWQSIELSPMQSDVDYPVPLKSRRYSYIDLDSPTTKTPNIRVLDFRIQRNGGNSDMMQLLHHVYQTTSLISRISITA
ncbi:hypothetical protein HPB50_025324 [Hyalomma asiaticum]|uniref:Uncharacterized protein n=1 Tax=Hyalomma asiaticum TaxID=266040 RepID=A0ACB7SR19_HYAAI|nr:hypothetical protein HPB50_025324 [Hyalomma asiaticum]